MAPPPPGAAGGQTHTNNIVETLRQPEGDPVITKENNNVESVEGEGNDFSRSGLDSNEGKGLKHKVSKLFNKTVKKTKSLLSLSKPNSPVSPDSEDPYKYLFKNINDPKHSSIPSSNEAMARQLGLKIK